MKVDNQKLEVILARRCKSISDLRSGVSSQTLTRIRRGENITTRTLGRIALELNCDPAELVLVELQTFSKGGSKA